MNSYSERCHEWIVYSRERENFALLKASSQKEAIIHALERGVRPKRSSDARPRTGDTRLMTRSEFKAFMDYED